MSVRDWWLATAMAVLFCTGAFADTPQAQPTPEPQVQAAQATPAQPTEAHSMPSWVPGPVMVQAQAPEPGRVAARDLGLAFTLPESWRADDVTWRELDATEAKTINPTAEAAMVVELAGKNGESQRLLTLYRLPLEDWRAADRTGKAGPGRITFTMAEKGYVVVRPPEATEPGRYATLRNALEDAIGTLALYDAYNEERFLRPQIGTDFSGKLIDGSAIALHMENGGKLTLTFGKDQRTIKGRWLQRDSQIVGQLLDQGDKVNPALLFHYDGKGLIAVKWDESLFGNIGVRLDKPQ